MQKISTYLYPNRIQLLADLAGFTTEYTNVYQRNVKVYQGVDNVLEFDIKNADQKRLELVTSPTITDLALNVMDESGNALPNSPYTVTPSTTIKGIATAIIPSADLEGFTPQYFRYSVTATKDTNTIPLYADSRFGAVGTIELIGSAMPTVRAERNYQDFTATIDLKGFPTYHSSAIPATFYEAVTTQSLSFDVSLKGFTGSVWLEATKESTINTEAFKGTPYLHSQTFTDFTGTWQSLDNPINNYHYFRISYATPTMNGVGASFEVERSNGHYTVTVRSGGTGYAVTSQLKVLGSVVGGVDGINDLIITVTHVDASSAGFTSSYAVSSITSVSTTGTAAAGTGKYIVTGTNITGTVDNIRVY